MPSSSEIEKDPHWEGRLERKIFQDIHREANYPDGGANVEAGMFPMLFPCGTGMFDQDRPIPLRFVEYRDHFLNYYVGGLGYPFRDNSTWKEWADGMVQTIAALRRGESVRLDQYEAGAGETAFNERVEEINKTRDASERAIRPYKIRQALEHQVENTAANRHERSQYVSDVLEVRLNRVRALQGSVIMECAVCHRYECPEDPDLKLSKCGRCRCVYYCGRDHQVQHWKTGHKKKCTVD